MIVKVSYSLGGTSFSNAYISVSGRDWNPPQTKSAGVINICEEDVNYLGILMK
jgi:hypothetical protein